MKDYSLFGHKTKICGSECEDTVVHFENTRQGEMDV
jgi:hypothetical protein